MIMFIISTIQKNIIKHWKKSSLSVVISAMIVLFLLLYIGNIEGNKEQLLKLGETIPVTGRICNIDGSQDVGLQIDFEKSKKIFETDLVTDEVITMQMYADLTTRSYEGKSHRPKFSFVGSNVLSAFTAFSPQDAVYINNYDESFLMGNEPVCIIREKFMKEQKVKPGDELEVIVYAPEYDENGMDAFKYKKIRNVKLKVIGSYHPQDKGLSDELPDVISPIGFATSIYEGTKIKPYASSGRFTLKEPLKLNEFKSKMQEIGFLSVDIQAGFSRVGQALTMNDETFIMSATQLTESLTLLQSFAPLIFIIVAGIGFISSYLLMQSRRNEFAIMRSLGTSKKKCFVIIFLESMVLALFGSLLMTILSVFVVNIKLMMMVFVLLTFLAFYMLGTAIALFLLNRFSVMAILSKTD